MLLGLPCQLYLMAAPLSWPKANFGAELIHKTTPLSWSKANFGVDVMYKAMSKPMFMLPRCSLTQHAIVSDPFVLQVAETFEDSITNHSHPFVSPAIKKLRDTSSQTLLSTSWPTRKDEPFRFTDTSLIRYSDIFPIPYSVPLTSEQTDSAATTQLPTVVVVDGVISSQLNLSGLPDHMFVGSLSQVPSNLISEKIYKYVNNYEGDLFWALNGIGTPDLIVVYVPAQCQAEKPLHLKYYSREGAVKESKKLPTSNPRVLVYVEEEGEISIIEEYVGGNDKLRYWTNSVTELVLGNKAKITHSYIQNQSTNAVHLKWTSTVQESGSTYNLVDASSGGKLSRHNIHIQQAGPDTVTDISTFHVSVSDQTQDLHSQIVLDHPRGYARQLHKCIVAHSLGQAVFDGNIRVNRDAQQTDAGQLTKCLLLEPRATANIKPNLQIVADDVRCSHGATVSDLEYAQLYFFRSRGIDFEAARRALVLSFGADAIDRLPTEVRNNVRSNVKSSLEALFVPPS